MHWQNVELICDLFSLLSSCFPEYCQKYAKPEDVGNASDDKSSDDEELSEDEGCDSSDEHVVGKPDL